MSRDLGVAPYVTGIVSLRDVMALANAFPLPMAASTQEHMVYVEHVQEERTGQGLRAAIQDPARYKVGRSNQQLRGQQRGRVMGDSDSCGWLCGPWFLMAQGTYPAHPAACWSFITNWRVRKSVGVGRFL